jgi:uncharacterized protein involved in exopolysaccharide biosynthesis
MEERRRQTQAQYDNEISLVDLASTFLRRRRVFYVVFVAALLAGIIYALFMPERYEYSSLVRLAEKEPGSYIEQPAAIIATLENRWLPEYQHAFRVEHDRPMPVSVRFVNPESTALIQITSEASPLQSESVEQAHAWLIEKLAQAQSSAVSNLKASLQSQIKSLSSTIKRLEGATDAGAAIAATLEKRLSLESTLNAIQPMEVLAKSRQSTDRKGTSRRLVVILAGLLGLMGGVFLAFFAEFASQVRAQMSES